VVRGSGFGRAVLSRQASTWLVPLCRAPAMRINVSLVLYSLSLFLCQHRPASASDYPERGIKAVTPFAAGAASDVELRLLAAKMSERLRVPVIVENHPGSGGVVAARTVTNAAHDGYTIGWVGNNTAISVSLFRQPFDPRKEMRPIAGVSEFAYLFVANEKSRFQSLKDFIEAAREHPDTLRIGTSSAGTSNHLTAILFALQEKLKVTVVPYRGPAELEVGLLRNDIDLVVNAYAGLQGAIKAHQIRALAVTSAQRLPELPETPTMAEQGVHDFVITSWNGLYGPKGMPDDAVAVLSRTITDILKEPDVVQKFKTLGFDARPVSPDQFGKRMEIEIDRWGHVIEAAGIQKQ
jgi:tripartite-type tricarboxylate transporter receptor subunit TctC